VYSTSCIRVSENRCETYSGSHLPIRHGMRRTADPILQEMQLLTDLFTTDYGLVALGFTLASLALAIGMRVFFLKKMRESEESD